MVLSTSQVRRASNIMAAVRHYTPTVTFLGPYSVPTKRSGEVGSWSSFDSSVDFFVYSNSALILSFI